MTLPFADWPALDIPPDDTFDACLFDCDGTLIDSMPWHLRAWNAALHASGADFDFPADLFQSLAGMETAKIVLRLNDRFQSRIDPQFCTGCNLCAQVCKFGAISPAKTGAPR